MVAKRRGAPVALLNPGTFTPSFIAPLVPLGAPPVQVSFQVTLTDNLGTSTDSVTVTVQSSLDTVTINTVNFRNTPRGGGKLNITTTSSDPKATLSVE